MKITIITGPFLSLPPNSIGAVEKLWHAVGNRWISQGHEVTFISKRSEGTVCNKNNVYVTGFERTGSWIKDCILDFIYSLSALRKVKECDVLILNTLWAPLMVRAYRRKIKLRVFSVERFPKNQLRYYRKIGKINCFRCNSTAVLNAVTKQDSDIKPYCCLIPNFIDTDTFMSDGQCRDISNKSAVTICYAGRINKEKGIHLLCRAVNELNRTLKKKKIRIEIIGAYSESLGGSGDAYIRELRQTASNTELVIHEPLYDPKELAKEIKKSDIFCYPSIAKYGETFGVSALEAMGLGIPTIVSDLDCFSDFITPGENALTFHLEKENTLEELKEKIKLLIEDGLAYQRIAINGAVTAKDFNVDNIAEMYINEFNRRINIGGMKK